MRQGSEGVVNVTVNGDREADSFFGHGERGGRR
jgi:hypothetical protein